MGAADIYLPNWTRGQAAALNVTVISTLQQLTLVGATSTPGHALWVGEERKMAAHAEACRAVGVLFVPLVVRSMGGWSDEAIHTIASIGCLKGQRLGIPLSESIRHLFQRLTISLWKGNATSATSQSSPSCQRGRTDLTDLVTSLFFKFIFCFYIFYICICCFMPCIIVERW